MEWLEHDEWLTQRAGLWTGSKVAVIAAGIGSDTAKNLLNTIKWERRIGKAARTYCNANMLRGNELENDALFAYELHNLNTGLEFTAGKTLREDGEVDKVLFMRHPEYPFIAVSPDALVGDDGLVEVKCPAESSCHYHQEHLDAKPGSKPYYSRKYIHQINLQLAVTGRQWCDVVSYYPIEDEPQPLAIYRVERDEKAIKKLIAAVLKAEEALNA